LLVEWDEDNRGELPIPDDFGLDDLIRVAKRFELLNAIKFQDSTGTPACSAVNVIREIQWMRNNLHPAKALRKSFDSATFDAAQYRKDNFLHYL